VRSKAKKELSLVLYEAKNLSLIEVVDSKVQNKKCNIYYDIFIGIIIGILLMVCLIIANLLSDDDSLVSDSNNIINYDGTDNKNVPNNSEIKSEST
jgi:hypothetical protein